MVLYHIDRKGEFHEPGIISLQPSGRSRHGDYYWKEKPMKDFSAVMNSVTEHFFESIRLKHFPHMPSRFTSFFACTEEQIQPWISCFERQGLLIENIWKVETTSDCYCLDSALLQTFWLYEDGLWFDPAFGEVCARAYWDSASIATLHDDRCPQPYCWLGTPDSPILPKWETLAGFPVHLLHRLPLEEIESLRRGQPRTAL